MEVSVKLLGVQMGVDDLHLHGIYKLYIHLVTFTCTILVFTSKYDEFGGFFGAHLVLIPENFHPKRNH
jgi:hypothetical protein